MANAIKPAAPTAPTSLTVRDPGVDLDAADLAAVAAFDETSAVFRQGWAINVDAYRPLTPEQVSARIAQARVRARFRADEWAPLADGTGPKSYGEYVEATARDRVWSASCAKGTVDKHRGAWALVTDSGVSHEDERAYGDAYLIARYSGGITTARKDGHVVRIAALPLAERSDAFRAMADRIIPTRAAAKAEQAAKAAKAAEDKAAEDKAAEDKAASMTPAEVIAAVLASTLRSEDKDGALSSEDWSAIAGILAEQADAARAKAAERVSATGDKLPAAA